ncbi:MAG: hypothetical protein JWL69_1805 [Phycisphaerales bacterium]|nr:hypothetical protein [Phycisphaerales bacterium]
MRRFPFFFAILALPGLLHAAPAAVSRVLRTFDFEERRLGNAEELPMNWLKVEGLGLPHYVNGTLATDRAHSGTYSFRFDLNGGGLIYRYPSGLIPVHVGAHYRVDGFVQTTVLPNARARISAYFTDLDGHVLTKTLHHSELYAARQADEPWKSLGVELSADDPAAAFLVLELELLQPSQYAPSTLGQRTLFTQDIRGSAWFDDVTVSQVPEVRMSTDRPGNIFRRDEPLRLQVVLNDRFTEDLAAQLVITDALGKTVYQRSGALDMASAEQIAPGQKRMVLALPDLRPGWYEAALVMSSMGKFLGSQSLDFILLPDNAPRVLPDPRFGIIATDLPLDSWDELPRILPLLPAGRVKLAIWSNAGDVQQLEGDSFDHLLEKLAELGVTPTACLIDPPPAMVEKIGGGSWTKLLQSDPKLWQPQLAYLIARHANHLDRWQLGADGTDAFVTDPKMHEVYSAVYREFAALMEKPDLAMPWPAWYDMGGELPATVALSVSPSVLPHQLPLYVQDLKGREGHNLSLSLELLDRERYGREAQINDLAQRVVYALSSGATRIDFPLPFTVRREGGTGGRGEHVVKQPRELLMVMRTLINTLGGAIYRGKVPIAEGVEAFLFDRDGQGVLVLWDRGNVGGMKTLALNLGERPVSVDLWGNVTPLLRAAGDKAAGKVQLTVGPMPTFLIDIDGAQAQLRASVAFDQPLLESSFEPHTRHIRFFNPYRSVLSGNLKLKAPPGWTLNPPTFALNLNPGEAFDREVTIAFPYNSFAGAKTIACEFTLQGEANGSFTVPVVLNLGLSDVGMQTLALRDGKDVIVQQMISNYGEKPIDYTAFAVCPGQARQERFVTGLGPGRTVMKRYRFTDVKAGGDLKARVGVKELLGTRILNDEVSVQ